jgi:hypothetical protein
MVPGSRFDAYPDPVAIEGVEGGERWREGILRRRRR